jgi:aryl-alcohol dehydrogenase-like predicted oxidoreductase
MMRRLQLGEGGPSVSLVGLGGSLFGRTCDVRQTSNVVAAALACGITFVDTAEAYPGSEACLGSALRGRRHEVVIASKFGHPQSYPGGGGAAPDTLRAALENSLRRLQTEYVDIYMLHFPDPITPIAETLAALHELVLEGKIRWLGVSNFDARQIVDACSTASFNNLTPLVCVENQYNLLERAVERDVLPVCRQYALGLIPHTPLASGLLSGRYARNAPPGPSSRLTRRWMRMSDADFDQLDRMHEFATARGVSLLELAIGWLAAQPRVGPIITGATTPPQIQANAVAAEWSPSAADLRQLQVLTSTQAGRTTSGADGVPAPG